MKLWKLEAVRGLAALYVAIGHVYQDASILLKFGQEAVIVFFLISGFVIQFSHNASTDKSFRAYFLKRFIRIYSVLVLLFLLCVILYRPDVSSVDFLRKLAGNLLMLQDFETGKPNVIVPTLFASALWSLHYEWWFYMLYFPVVTFIPRLRQVSLVSIGAIISAFVYLFYPIALVRLLMYFVVWWIGVELAISYQKNNAVRVKDIAAVVVATIVVTLILLLNVALQSWRGGALSFGIHPVLELRHFIAAIATLVIALIWQRFNWIGFFMLKPGLFLAPISYSLYIGHQPLLVYASYLGWIDNGAVRFVLYVLFLMIFCWIVELKIYPSIRRHLKIRPTKR